MSKPAEHKNANSDNELTIFRIRSLADRTPKAVLAKAQAIAIGVSALARTAFDLLPPCRETSMFVTKLEEATMWAMHALCMQVLATPEAPATPAPPAPPAPAQHATKAGSESGKKKTGEYD